MPRAGWGPEATPGRFKTTPNRVSAMTFVAPDAVLGTSDCGFDIYRPLVSPFHRAACIHLPGAHLDPPLAAGHDHRWPVEESGRCGAGLHD